MAAKVDKVVDEQQAISTDAHGANDCDPDDLVTDTHVFSSVLKAGTQSFQKN